MESLRKPAKFLFTFICFIALGAVSIYQVQKFLRNQDSSTISFSLTLYFPCKLSLYKLSCSVSKSICAIDFVGLSIFHFLGLGVKMSLQGQEAGSAQKCALFPHRKCILHPDHSPGGRSGCLVPFLEVVGAVPEAAPRPPRPLRPPRPRP